MRDRFPSDTRIAALKAPLLVMHGEQDALIPLRLGRRLFDLAPEPKRFVAFPLGTHVNLESLGAIDTAHAFLSGTE